MTRRVAYAVVVVTLLALCAFTGAVLAEEELERTTPRDAAADFLAAARRGDYARAAVFLDLQRIPQAERATRGAHAGVSLPRGGYLCDLAGAGDSRH